jgi:antitoxin (DNA-binding transcriptional repressor) of toxin-antitoxin stability system
VSAMITVEVAQAKLKELIDGLIPGEEVVLTENQLPVAKLVATARQKGKPRQPGTLRGTVIAIALDFDAPLEDFKDYME